MKIVMHVMGMPFSGDTLLTKSLGGSETAGYYMARELAALGHSVTIFTRGGEGRHDDVLYQDVGNITQVAPLGERFHLYAESTPHDVCIIQRHPEAFAYRWASKKNLWWLHDLAIYRTKDKALEHLWNIDGVLCVSEFHKEQINKVWGISKDVMHVVRNAVDHSLFEDVELKHDALDIVKASKKKKLIYISRPERGLDWLVHRNGIMETLGNNYELFTCSYKNPSEQLADYYAFIDGMSDRQPNVTPLGHLDKATLAQVLKQCDAMVYPTPAKDFDNFEEVSCIAAIEAMCAGLPFISTQSGALPETCEGAGKRLIQPPMGDPDTFVSRMVYAIEEVLSQDTALFKQRQLRAAQKYTWRNSALSVPLILEPVSDSAKLTHLIRHSDIFAISNMTELDERSAIVEAKINEVKECYSFVNENTYKEHYDAYYQDEADRGVQYGKESLDGNNRFEFVSSLIGRLPNGSTVLDYGCGHGHYTNNLAQRHTEINFVGIDISEPTLGIAREWAKADGIENVVFFAGDASTIEGYDLIEDSLNSVDCVLACEVLEHVADYRELINNLESLASDRMIITTPYGGWEAMEWGNDWMNRQHLHEFEHSDLTELLGGKDDFRLTCCPAGRDHQEKPLGSYIAQWSTAALKPLGEIDYERKLSEISPIQTVSLCMIVKDSRDTILQCLNSVKGAIDELVIGFDGAEALEIVNDWCSENHVPVTTMMIESPVKVGFDVARNSVLEHCTGDWILWLDSDEKLVNPNNLAKYLRPNCFDSYAITQNHYSEEPAGIMKVDLPCKLFRNDRGISFLGRVHEHPEKGINQGAGNCYVIEDVEVSHYGYVNESVRRKRFSRNTPLMELDREVYPDRTLGKVLWMRDIAQEISHALAVNGGVVTQAMRDDAEKGIELWRELLNNDSVPIRYPVDFIEFYNVLTKTLGNTFEFKFKVASSKMNGGAHLEKQKEVTGHFTDDKDLKKLLDRVVDLRIKNYESKYF